MNLVLHLLLSFVSIENYIKHSRQCFIEYLNTSNFIKNTLLYVIFSTLFSVFGYTGETLPCVFDIYYIKIKVATTHLYCWRNDITYKLHRECKVKKWSTYLHLKQSIEKKPENSSLFILSLEATTTTTLFVHIQLEIKWTKISLKEKEYTAARFYKIDYNFDVKLRMKFATNNKNMSYLKNW